MVPVTAALINLVCIVTLNLIYDRMAVWLTEMELQRTQTEYDDSLAVKIYMFQFVNYYSCIFYIAFFKGKFVGYPSKYNKIFGYRQEEVMILYIVLLGCAYINSVSVQPWGMFNGVNYSTCYYNDWQSSDEFYHGNAHPFSFENVQYFQGYDWNSKSSERGNTTD